MTENSSLAGHRPSHSHCRRSSRERRPGDAKSEIPFENAKRALDARIAHCDPFHAAIGFDGDRASRMLIPCALLDDEERTALRALARIRGSAYC